MDILQNMSSKKLTEYRLVYTELVSLKSSIRIMNTSTLLGRSSTSFHYLLNAESLLAKGYTEVGHIFQSLSKGTGISRTTKIVFGTLITI